IPAGACWRAGPHPPADLVTRPAEHGMTALALTDRDGLYGAVKFALACRSAGVRRSCGVDLAIPRALDPALAPALAVRLGDRVPPRWRTPARRSPARGGAS